MNTQRRVRSLLLFAPCLLGAADGAERAIEVTATCEHKATKGRVICDVEIEAGGGSVVWADVLVVEAPLFAPPLRSRVAVADARARTQRRIRIPVAFVATAQGRGTVTVRGRAVVCGNAPGAAQASCRAVSKEAKAELVVGTDVER
jgi:precorrin isomerase